MRPALSTRFDHTRGAMTSMIFKIFDVARHRHLRSQLKALAANFHDPELCIPVRGPRFDALACCVSTCLAHSGCSFSRQCCLEGPQRAVIWFDAICSFKIKLFKEFVMRGGGRF